MTELRETGVGVIPPIKLGHRLRIALEYAGLNNGDMAAYLGVVAP